MTSSVHELNPDPRTVLNSPGLQGMARISHSRGAASGMTGGWIYHRFPTSPDPARCESDNLSTGALS